MSRTACHKAWQHCHQWQNTPPLFTCHQRPCPLFSHLQVWPYYSTPPVQVINDTLIVCVWSRTPVSKHKSIQSEHYREHITAKSLLWLPTHCQSQRHQHSTSKFQHILNLFCQYAWNLRNLHLLRWVGKAACSLLFFWLTLQWTALPLNEIQGDGKRTRMGAFFKFSDNRVSF